jgi:hypothetical protein
VPQPAPAPTPPPDPVPVPPPSGRTLLTANDLIFQGMWRFPAGEPGAHFSEGGICHRYVSGERRWLLVSWPYGGNTFQIREYRAPATYGATRDTAPEMAFVRGWTKVFNIGPDPGNGWCIGDIWYDHAQDVLWYTVYPFYSTGIFPFLGATRLNDNGTTTLYGPWYYLSTSETTQHLKQVCKWMVPIPASAQAACGGRSIAMGADVMSIGATANWGPGLLGMTLPTLGTSTPVPIGLPLMAYNATLHGDGHEYYCKRENDYSDLFASDAIIEPVGAEGYWAVSLDAVGSFSWVDTGTKHGIVVFGRRGRGRCWYGSPDAFGNGTLVDQYQNGSGFHAEFYDPALWIFDPAHLLEAAQGTRLAYDVGFQSNTNWGTLWPNIPTDPGSPPGGGGIFWTPGGAVHGGAHDQTTNQIFWLLPLTYKPGSDRLPTIQVWSV